jgi:oxygen-independent coproporphyrinogen-3 oxidase
MAVMSDIDDALHDGQMPLESTEPNVSTDQGVDRSTVVNVALAAKKAPKDRAGHPPPSQGRLPPEYVLALIAAAMRPDHRSDLLLYVHIPFCSSKCHFCDLVADIPVAQLLSGHSIRESYAGAICDQINYYGPRLHSIGYRPRLVYWGGGTPSRLDPQQIVKVGEALRSSFKIEATDEYTVEMSPETVDRGRLAAFASIGANRISLGVQSFDDEVLRRAGRAHRAAKAENAIALIKQSDFISFNVDLMFGMPDEGPWAVEESVRKAVALNVPHITLYPYRSDSRTVMAKQIVRGYRHNGRDVDLERLYRLAKSHLNNSGYIERAVGYFAKTPELRCKTEEYYFGLQGDYIGFGSRAKSVLAGHALDNEARLQDYIADPLSFRTCDRFLPNELNKIMQTLVRSLWLPEGINYRAFEDFFGYPFSAIRDHATLKTALSFYQHCGASFHETENRLYVSAETRARAGINSISSAHGARLAQERVRARAAMTSDN